MRAALTASMQHLARRRVENCQSDSGKIDKRLVFKAFRQSCRIGCKLPRRRIVAPIGEGAFRAGQRDGVEPGTGARDDRAFADADAVRLEEGDLVAGEGIVAEGGDVVCRTLCPGERPQAPTACSACRRQNPCASPRRPCRTIPACIRRSRRYRFPPWIPSGFGDAIAFRRDAKPCLPCDKSGMNGASPNVIRTMEKVVEIRLALPARARRAFGGRLRCVRGHARRRAAEAGTRPVALPDDGERALCRAIEPEAPEIKQGECTPGCSR